MAKRVTEMGDDGRLHTYTATRSRRRSEAQLIPWTPGPRTAWERFKRAAKG